MVRFGNCNNNCLAFTLFLEIKQTTSLALFQIEMGKDNGGKRAEYK